MTCQHCIWTQLEGSSWFVSDKLKRINKDVLASFLAWSYKLVQWQLLSLFCKAIVINGTSWLLSTLSNCVVFFLFSVVFSDPSSSCLLVRTGVCCSTFVETWCKRQRWRQGELVSVSYIVNQTIYCRENMNVYSQRNLLQLADNHGTCTFVKYLIIQFL